MTAIVALTPRAPDTLPQTAPATLLEPQGKDDAPDAATIALLNRLRLVGLRCRAARKAPPIEACQLLAASGAQPVSLDLLLRSLPQALGRLPVFYAPGTAELSFDEAWLLRLIHALRSGDVPTSDFLLRSRVPVYARRSLVFLLNHALPDDLKTT